MKPAKPMQLTTAFSRSGYNWNPFATMALGDAIVERTVGTPFGLDG